jgi:cytochrome c oxidase subunit 2
MLDKFEGRIIFYTGILLSIFLVGLIYAVTERNVNVPSCIPYDKPFTQGRIVQIDSNTYQVFYMAKMWAFDPAEVRLPVGSKVDFYLTSGDVVHGFMINTKNINMAAIPGALNKTSATFDKPGIYRVTCNEYCGAGHQSMQSEIIVNYK